MIFCSKCGTQLPEDAKFCDKCGAAIPQQAPVPVPLAQSFPAPVSGDFFSLGEYVIDEKVSVLKFTNAYRLFDLNGNPIGSIEQQKISGGAKAARVLLGGNVKAMQGFRLDIKDAGGNVLVSVQRGGLGSAGGLRNVSLLDGSGQLIGSIKILFSFLTPKQEILDSNGQVIGRIQGDWKGWNFTITDLTGNSIGTVNKKWSGAARELFTTADKYRVSVSPQAAGAFRPTIIAAAVTLDMVLKEFK